MADPAMMLDVASPAAVRQKVESWLGGDDGHEALALRARPEWTGDASFTVGETLVRVVPCPTPLAARAAISDRREGERVVLLTDLTDIDLGDGVLAHVSRCTVRSIDPWVIVSEMFPGTTLDPTLARDAYGGGRWVARAFAEYSPAGGWPPPPGKILTRGYALRSLCGRLLDLPADQLDSASLLDWTQSAPRVLDFTGEPADVVAGVATFLGQVAGPAAVPIMKAVRAGHGVDAVPLGLLVGALWPGSATTLPSHDVIVARTRLEPYFGNSALSDADAEALRAASEAWIDRVVDSGGFAAAQPMLRRAESLAAQIGATDLLAASDLLPTGFQQRLRLFAESIRSVTAKSVAQAESVTPAAIRAPERALESVERHRAGDPVRTGAARMALRLLRWLSTADAGTPPALLDALHRQVRDDGWVDRARLDVFAGDVDPLVTQAYKELHHAVDARRRRHDEQFASLLASATAANALPGGLFRVEDVLDRVVRPIIAEGRRVLLLVMDGMSVAAATELVESITETGTWGELTPEGGPRVGVLAALPTVTQVSRCSLFSGRIAVGGQAEEVSAFTERFPDGLLLHKARLRAGAGAALDAEVVEAVRDAFKPVVGAVINAVDDSLDRSDPGTIVWSQDTVAQVRDLLAIARDRVVVVVSDHGHIVDRGPEAQTMSSPSSENRWRPADPPARSGEIDVHGARVGIAGGCAVLAVHEEIRYGPRKSGYHGGASAAEAVIPLMVLSADVDGLPGWRPAPVASPAWWRESVGVAEPPVEPTAPKRKRPTPAAAGQEGLFEVAAAPAVAAGPPSGGGAALVDALVASDLYRRRRVQNNRARLDDERVKAVLRVLVDNGGRARSDNVAAQAGVPAHRMSLTTGALRSLLQVEGYPVLELDPDGQTLTLDIPLLKLQFGLDIP